MIPAEPTPDPEPATPPSPGPQPPSSDSLAPSPGLDGLPAGATPVRRSRWPWLVVVVLAACVVLGLVVGINVGLRGTSFFPGQLASARPTIVVIARVDLSPSPGARSTSVPSTATTATEATAGQYIVEDGDTMRGVALKVYGDADLWPRIYSANRDLIGPNPDDLQVGMHLNIPPAD